MTTLDHILTLPGLVLVLMCFVTAKAVAQRLGDRAAEWLVPADQTTSFRLAWVVVRVAAVIAPRDEIRFRGIHPFYREPSFYFRERKWTAPEEALADLDDAYRHCERAVDPLRLVLPLLGEALVMRLANGVQRATGFRSAVTWFLLWLLGLVISSPFLPVRLFEHLREVKSSPVRDYRPYVRRRAARRIRVFLGRLYFFARGTRFGQRRIYREACAVFEREARERGEVAVRPPSAEKSEADKELALLQGLRN